MSKNINRIGIEVLSEETLMEHGDRIGGGYGTMTYVLGMLPIASAIYFTYIAYQRRYNAGGAMARIAGDCFANLTRSCCASILLYMRNQYGAGSQNYNYYNIAYNQVVNHGANVQDAFQTAENNV